MIKLVVSDIDGTLIPYGETAMDPTLFPLIRRLRERGILFCPASGRQYHSIRTLFAPVADDLAYLCENGAAVFGLGTEETRPVLEKTVMDREEAVALSNAILALPGHEVLISGENTSYVSRRSPAFAARMRGFTGNNVRTLTRPEDVPEEILKVSVFCPETVRDEPARLARWDGPFRMAVAGPEWLDFTLADKGTGLRGLCRALGVSLDGVAAFGDNWNDLPMLRIAGRPYLMEGADPALREEGFTLCRRVTEVLETFLEE
ncbi:MAG: HAD family phosphatase [Clostridia bacterium]|nr:HAD family phosphatase [Clostridia bacterium]